MNQHRRSAVALRHVAFEDLGLLAAVMETEGWNVSFCEAAIDDLTHRSIRNADLLIVLGGPIGVYEIDAYPFLKAEIALLEHRLSRTLPTLGICLGAQLMAKALGSRVFAGPVKEIGWGGVKLTKDGMASCLGALDEPDAAVGFTRSPYSFTSKPIRGSSRNGMSAMPWNWPRPKSRSRISGPRPRSALID
jgi:GMP synthase (glutamine-hydrolysing)